MRSTPPGTSRRPGDPRRPAASPVCVTRRYIALSRGLCPAPTRPAGILPDHAPRFCSSPRTRFTTHSPAPSASRASSTKPCRTWVAASAPVSPRRPSTERPASRPRPRVSPVSKLPPLYRRRKRRQCKTNYGCRGKFIEPRIGKLRRKPSLAHLARWPRRTVARIRASGGLWPAGTTTTKPPGRAGGVCRRNRPARVVADGLVSSLRYARRASGGGGEGG